MLFLWLLVIVSSGSFAGMAPAASKAKIFSATIHVNADSFIGDLPGFDDAVADLSHVHSLKLFKHNRHQPALKASSSASVFRTAIDAGSTAAARYASADYIPVQRLLLFPKHYFW